jgi:pantoate--beta-alanine ligase
VRVLRTISEFRAARRVLNGSVGLVPTMGFLHAGHLALVAAACCDNDHVVASIFVNPTQFGRGEDFETYPRDEERDLSLLEKAGVELVFVPGVGDMYPRGFETRVEVGPIGERLEGEFRPGHFRGVATVVLKLLNIVGPDRAYFGRKDAQQLVVIEKMARDLDLPVEIVPVETVREPDGLALSSRNVYLSPVERESAACLWQALTLAREMWTRGVRDATAFRARMRELIEGEPTATIDYVSVADPQTLEELERIQGPALVSLAVRIGKTRLIDNATLGDSEQT